MPYYRQVGEVPRKRHIKLPRENGKSFLGEGIAYEHVVTTAGFDPPAGDGADVHVYFDNDARGRAPHDALGLSRRLSDSSRWAQP